MTLKEELARLIAYEMGDTMGDSRDVFWSSYSYKDLADKMKEAAKELDIPIKWGGDWTTLKDGPHFELDRTVYP